MPTMQFYVTRTADGLIHVQNALMGHIGQHHVHTPDHFEAWRRPSDTIIETKAHTCDCKQEPDTTKTA